jgi:hypothetical protein
MNHSSTLTAAIATIEPSSFCFSPENPILINPSGQSGCSRADHDDDQVCSQREIDKRKDADDHISRGGCRHLHHEFGELDDELVDEGRMLPSALACSKSLRMESTALPKEMLN